MWTSLLVVWCAKTVNAPTSPTLSDTPTIIETESPKMADTETWDILETTTWDIIETSTIWATDNPNEKAGGFYYSESWEMISVSGLEEWMTITSPLIFQWSAPHTWFYEWEITIAFLDKDKNMLSQWYGTASSDLYTENGDYIEWPIAFNVDAPFGDKSKLFVDENYNPDNIAYVQI